MQRDGGKNIQEVEHKLVPPKEEKQTLIGRLHEDIQRIFEPLDLPVALPQNIRQMAIKEKRKSYKEFNHAVHSPPPKDLTFSFKTDACTFNHVNDYVIHHGVIWYRRRGQTDQDWRVMYLEGNITPIVIQADGANFIAVDTDGYVHYRKVLKETLRIFEIEAKNFGPPKKKDIVAKNETHDFAIKEVKVEKAKDTEDGKKEKIIEIHKTVWVRAKGESWKPFHVKCWPDRSPETLSLEGDIAVITDEAGQTYREGISEKDLKEKFKGQTFPFENHYAYYAETWILGITG